MIIKNKENIMSGTDYYGVTRSRKNVLKMMFISVFLRKHPLI